MAFDTRRKAAAPPAEDDDLVNDTTGIGGDEYYPMDGEAEGDDAPLPDEDLPPVDGDGDADIDDAPPDEMKPGAQALTELHDHFMDIGEIISRLSDSQEHPEVQKHLDKVAATLDKSLTELTGLFSKLYPDHPQPGAGSEPLPEEITKGEGMGETEGSDGGFLADEDADDEDPETLTKRHRARKRFIKRLDMARAWRGLVRQKRHSSDHHVVMTKAAEHLEECGDHEGDWTNIHKAACHYHAKGIRNLCKAFEPGATGDVGDAPSSMPDEAIMKRYEERVSRYAAQVKNLNRQLELALKGR